MKIKGFKTGAVMLLFAGAVLATAIVGCPPGMVTVPDVTNAEYSMLQTSLAAARLTLGGATGEYSDTVEENRVISQDPVAGTAVNSGTAINMTVSLGKLPQSPVADALTSEQSVLADATESAEVKVDAVVLEGGDRLTDYPDHVNKGVAFPKDAEAQRKQVLADMLYRALFLCNRTLWQYPNEGADKPAQNGLAYVWGGKHPELRVASADTCTDLLHGADCSGFVYQCAIAAGIPIPQGTASVQGMADTWNNALPAAWQLEMKPLAGGTPLESGDIVCWGTHIGIVVSNGAALFVAQSNGQPNECTQNQSNTRGSRIVPYNQILGWFTQPPTFLRLSVKQVSIEGTWKGTLRGIQPTEVLVQFSGGHFSMAFPQVGTALSGTYTTDEGHIPHHIDLYTNDIIGLRSPWPGLYVTDGATLQLGFIEVGIPPGSPPVQPPRPSDLNSANARFDLTRQSKAHDAVN